MSVDYTACLGIGWIVSAEQKEAMLAAAGDRRDEVEDEFYYVNGYHYNSDCLLGEIIFNVDAGEYLELTGLSETWGVDIPAFVNKYSEIFHICGVSTFDDKFWSQIHLYIIHCLS